MFDIKGPNTPAMIVSKFSILLYCVDLFMKLQRSGPGSSAASLLEARRVRRQRKLDMVEIPEPFVTVTDELLGKGGFGAVYIEDYNGRNVAAKVSCLFFSLMGIYGTSTRRIHYLWEPPSISWI